jgi:excisionase family DNA binding protein
MKRESSWPHPKMAYTIEEAAELLSLSRAQLYRLIEVEDLPTVKVGKARRITYAQLEQFVQCLEQSHGFVRF